LLEKKKIIKPSISTSAGTISKFKVSNKSKRNSIQTNVKSKKAIDPILHEFECKKKLDENVEDISAIKDNLNEGNEVYV